MCHTKTKSHSLVSEGDPTILGTASLRGLSGYLLVLTATLIWSGNFIIARGLPDHISPVTLSFLRWLTALFVIAPFAVKSLWCQRSIIRHNLVFLSAVAFLAVTLFNTLLYIAAHDSSALNMTLIAISSPVFVVVLARIFLGEPLTPQRIIGLLLAVTGIVLLITGGDITVLTNLTFSIGDFWMLVAAVAFAAYSILVKYKPEGLSQIAFLASIIILGFTFLIPWALWENLYDGKLELSFRVLTAIGYIGVGPSIIAFLCWNRAVLEIGPTRTAFVYYSLPVFSGLEAYLFLDEPISWIHILSGMLIIFAIVLANVYRNDT